MAKQGMMAQLGYIAAWLLLTVLATATAWQMHVTLLYFVALLVESPTLRPTGWSTGTVASASRLSIVIWGSLWLIFILYLEHQLREALQEGELRRRSVRYGIVLLLLFGIGYLITGL